MSWLSVIQCFGCPRALVIVLVLPLGLMGSDPALVRQVIRDESRMLLSFLSQVLRLEILLLGALSEVASFKDAFQVLVSAASFK